MGSNINAAVPPFGNATTAGVRANFASAKAEIESLQTAKVLRLQHLNETTKTLQTIAASNTQQVVQFNTETFNNGGIFTFDSVNNEVVFLSAGWYQVSINFHVERQTSGGAAVDFYLHGEVMAPGGAWQDFPGSSIVFTLESSDANLKKYGSMSSVGKILVANTRMRWMQTCTDSTKTVGICTYPPLSATIPSAAGITLAIHKISEDL